MESIDDVIAMIEASAVTDDSGVEMLAPSRIGDERFDHDLARLDVSRRPEPSATSTARRWKPTWATSTGEVEVRGAGLGGLAVHIAARIAALAAEGEVLVSSTVKELLAGSENDFEEPVDGEFEGDPEGSDRHCPRPRQGPESSDRWSSSASRYSTLVPQVGGEAWASVAAGSAAGAWWRPRRPGVGLLGDLGLERLDLLHELVASSPPARPRLVPSRSGSRGASRRRRPCAGAAPRRPSP